MRGGIRFVVDGNRYFHNKITVDYDSYKIILGNNDTTIEVNDWDTFYMTMETLSVAKRVLKPKIESKE